MSAQGGIQSRGYAYDDSMLLRYLQITDTPRDSGAVQVGHAYVHQNQGMTVLLPQTQAFLSARSKRGLGAHLFK